jgi:hypothetical protein
MILEQLIEIESLLPGVPWLPPNAETTRSNNCIAYADLRGPDGLDRGDIIGRVSSARASMTPIITANQPATRSIFRAVPQETCYDVLLNALATAPMKI